MSTATTEAYAARVMEALERGVRDRVERLASAGVELPSPGAMADLLQVNLPDLPPGLDPHYTGLGPFYATDGAMRQLGGVSKQALDSRRRHESVLAMRAEDGTWLYPAWQFTGHGTIHPALVPVLRALRGLDRWAAGVWLVADHPDLDDKSPRRALREGADPTSVAALAGRDTAALAA